MAVKPGQWAVAIVALVAAAVVAGVAMGVEVRQVFDTVFGWLYDRVR